MAILMATHFLLSAKARTLSLVHVARLSDEQALATFRALRWHETGGDPVVRQFVRGDLEGPL